MDEFDNIQDVFNDMDNILIEKLGEEVFSRLEEDYYPPSSTIEYVDRVTGNWYTTFGKKLRNPDEYNNNLEGYTPFGDE